MKYERTMSFYVILALVAIIIVGALYYLREGIFSGNYLVWLFFVIPILSIAIMSTIYFPKSIRSVEIKGNEIVLNCHNNQDIVIKNAHRIYLVSGYRGMRELQIAGEQGVAKINAPFSFKNYRQMFLDLESAARVKIRNSEGSEVSF